MAWQKGFVSVGGETEGQVLQITPYIWPGYTCGTNTYNTFTMNDDHLFSAFPIDLDWSGPSTATNKLFFKLPKKDSSDNITGFVAFRYSYEKGVNSQGRVFLTVRGDLGYMDTQGNYTSVLGISDVTQSIGGTSIYQFKAFCHICFDIRNGETLLGVAIQVEDLVNTDFDCKGILTTQSFVQGLSGEKTHSPEFGDGSEPKGGYGEDSERKGTFDDSSDKITYSSAPTMHAGMTGFFHAYFVTQSQLQHIGKAMFPQAQSSYTDLIDAMAGVVTSIWNSKKVDCLVDCLVLPISVPFGSETNIQCGGGDLIYFDGATWQNIKGNPVTDYYVDVNCGTLELEEYWCNYLDYSGTRIKIFLPYIGFVNLQPEYINGGSVNVKYRFNVIDGSFMCVLHSTSGKSNLDESLIGQYSGMACLHIPITSQNYSQQISGLISSSGMAVTAGLTGNAGMAFGSAMNLANTLSQKPSTSHNNGYNSSSSFLSHRKPYIIIERQVAQFSTQYPEENGLPSYVSKPLSQIHGFTILDNPVLNIDCNADEYNEIISLLKTGVIF